jgi:hypothetical protein
MRWTIDPRYEEEVSGCTACVGLINDEKIYIVCFASPGGRVATPRPEGKDDELTGRATGERW